MPGQLMEIMVYVLGEIKEFKMDYKLGFSNKLDVYMICVA